MTVRVSVIVPLYNKARTVGATIESVLNQSMSDFELIVVDDGSTDRSASVVRSMNDQRIRLLHQRNSGPGGARNAGLREARAPIVAFLDADDTWLPGYLDAVASVLESDASIAAVTTAWIDMPPGVSSVAHWRKRGLAEGHFSVTPETTVKQLVAAVAFMSPCTTAARTSTLRSLGGFYQKDRCAYGEDAHLWLKVLLTSRVYFRMEAFARFDRSASELSSNYERMRPVEPFLRDASEIWTLCPQTLQHVLDDFLSVRAMKTACVFTYWGDWRSGAELVRRHFEPRTLLEPYSLLALLLCNPIGALSGSMLRRLRK